MTPRTDSDALLPCPFCGSTDLIEDKLARVCCENCGATAPYGYKVSESWNTRADSPAIVALRKERDALREALEGLDNWAAILRQLIEDTSCRPEDGDYFNDILMCFDMQAKTSAAALATDGQS